MRHLLHGSPAGAMALCGQIVQKPVPPLQRCRACGTHGAPPHLFLRLAVHAVRAARQMQSGQTVRAAAAGRVVYSGGGLIGYGQLIIVKHNDTYLSAYGHNASLLVEEGDNIKKGQRIATMGEGPGQEPRLHFEIRRNGKPVNPRQYLPAR